VYWLVFSFQVPSQVSVLSGQYKIRYVYPGSRERVKHRSLEEEKFSRLMKVFFQSGNVIVYERIEPL